MKAETKYLDDYVDYMMEKFPGITRAGIREMMEDSLEIMRQALHKSRHVKMGTGKSPLFGEGFRGYIRVSTIYSPMQETNERRRVRWKKEDLKKLEDDKNNNK